MNVVFRFCIEGLENTAYSVSENDNLPGPGGTSGVHVQCVEGNMEQQWDVGLQSAVRVRGVTTGGFHHQYLTLVLQDLRCVCGLAGEAKIDSWHKVLHLGSSLLNRLLCLPSDTTAAASHRGILAEVLLV